MAVPTTDTIFAQVRAADSWVEYPFMERGDSTAKIYHMRCRVNLDDYAPIAINTTMTSAAAAGVISLPFTANASAYFVGDFNHAYSDGKLVEFDRQFATIPATRSNELTGSRSFPFPAYRGILYTPPATAEQGDGGNNDNLWEWDETGTGNTSPAVEYTTSEYYLSANIPGTLPVVFQPTHNGLYVDFVTNGGSGSFSPGKALDGESFTGSYSVAATVPSASAYLTSVSNGELKIVDVSVERYKGDIFLVRTVKAPAQ